MKKLREVFRPGTGYVYFLLALLTTGIGYSLYKGIIDNYLAEIVGMEKFDRGVAEFFRELPGLMLVFILAALYMFSAQRVYKIGAIICVAGMGMLAVVPSTKVLVTLAICVYSLGEHIQLGMKTTMSLEYAQPGKGGQALGYQSAITQIGTVLGYAVVIPVFILSTNSKPFRPFFLISCGLLLAGTILAFKIKGESRIDNSKSRFYFRKKFTKYYMLEVFYGARKQVFFTFGPYVLIKHYGASASTISVLLMISAIACFLLSPVVGRIIDRVGYKPVMIGDTLILVIVCFFYGFADHIFPVQVAFIVCCVNYILDSVISLASLASNVYVQDISDSPEETKMTISTGISVNHMITVFIALLGGWIWEKLGVETLFTLSAVLGLCNSAYAATIKTNRKTAR